MWGSLDMHKKVEIKYPYREQFPHNNRHCLPKDTIIEATLVKCRKKQKRGLHIIMKFLVFCTQDGNICINCFVNYIKYLIVTIFAHVNR